MTEASAAKAPVTREPDVDENGVDLAQIREMLDLTPAQRLSYVSAFVSSLLAIRDRNENPGPG